MKTLLSVYGINALAFSSNLATVFVFLALAGPRGYGSYGLYIVFLAIYHLWDISLIKTALVVRDDAQRRGEGNPDGLAVAFMNGSLLPFLFGSGLLIATGDLIYPPDSLIGMGGMFVIVVVAGEHLLSYPANRIIYHLTVEKRFPAIYAFRLSAILLRHACSWGVLLFTGSVFWAILAILVKGLVLGGVSLVWIANRYSVVGNTRPRLIFSHLTTITSFFLAAVLMVVMQELPSLYVDRVYGREALGNYRALYDVVNAVWFLATIYPTILFSYLLAGKKQFQKAETTALLVFFGDRLALFHLAYFFGVCGLILGERLFLSGYFEKIPYAIAVVAGVSILGYSRFLVEAAQAYGQGRQVLGATLATLACVALVLVLRPAMASPMEVGWAWLIGQVFFFVLLKISLLAFLKPTFRVFRDAAVLVLPMLFIVLMGKFLPEAMLLGVCVLGAALSLSALLVLWRREAVPKG